MEETKEGFSHVHLATQQDGFKENLDGHMKVKDFLKDVTTGTKVKIVDDLTEKYYHNGKVGEYLKNKDNAEDLRIIDVYVVENMWLIIRAKVNYM